jgi:hypothetical protein
MKPAGQIITGVQNTIFLSLTAALLYLRGTREAAYAIEPERRLLVSLMTESCYLLLELSLRVVLCLGGINKKL